MKDLQKPQNLPHIFLYFVKESLKSTKIMLKKRKENRQYGM